MKTGFKVCDAMTREPIVVSPDSTLQDCARVMHEEHVGAVLVKDGKKLAGIITEQDIVRKSVILNEMPSKKKAGDIMEKKVNTIEPHHDIYDALSQMRDLNIRHLPVVDEGEMVGLLTLKDILKIQPQLFELLAEKIELREQERKPLDNQAEKEGVCNQCGKYADELFSQEGALVCKDCRE